MSRQSPLLWMAHSLPHISYLPSAESFHDPRYLLHSQVQNLLRTYELDPVPPPDHILADLLLGMGIHLGMQVEKSDLSKLDKSNAVDKIVENVLEQFAIALSPRGERSSKISAMAFLEPVCTMITIRWPGTELSSTFALWCLGYSLRFDSSSIQTPRLPESTVMIDLLEDDSDYAAKKILRLSVKLLCSPPIKVDHSETRNPLERLFFGTPPSISSPFHVGTAEHIAEQLIATALRYKLQSEGHEGPAEGGTANEHAISHALFALSCLPTAPFDAEDPRILEIALWSMTEGVTPTLHAATLKLLRWIFQHNTKAMHKMLDLPDARFFVALNTATNAREYAPGMESHNRQLVDIEFVAIVALICQCGGKYEGELFEHNLSRVFQCTFDWANSTLLVPLRNARWEAALRILIRHGWMPDNEQMVATFYEVAWNHSLEHSTTSQDILLPDLSRLDDPLVEEESAAHVFRLRYRLDAGIRWLEYWLGRAVPLFQSASNEMASVATSLQQAVKALSKLRRLKDTYGESDSTEPSQVSVAAPIIKPIVSATLPSVTSFDASPLFVTAYPLIASVSPPDEVLADRIIGAGVLLNMTVTDLDMEGPNPRRDRDTGIEIERILSRLLWQFQTEVFDTRDATTFTHTLTLLEPICELVSRRFAHVGHQTNFPTTCLALCMKLDQRGPIPEFRRIRESGSYPFTGDVVSWALRLSVQIAAADPNIPSTELDDNALWRAFFYVETDVPWPDVLQRLTPISQSLIGYASRLKEKCESFNPSQEKELHVGFEAARDAILALSSLVEECINPDNPMLTPLILWSLRTGEHQHLPFVGLKLLYRLRNKLVPWMLSLLRERDVDFFASLRAAAGIAPHPHPLHYSITAASHSHAVAFMEITAALANYTFSNHSDDE
ncbi:hypothetical protein HGRIS_010771 [Hohenbuehelia grisea]|uniref:Uncharacterized protein n=1 Tax=Hohenbuehelia grisea TaxID=104357 RepID=A0ABR3IXP8_9AGAR